MAKSQRLLDALQDFAVYRKKGEMVSYSSMNCLGLRLMCKALAVSGQRESKGARVQCSESCAGRRSGPQMAGTGFS